MKRFFFHYNKPASKEAGFPKISLHYNKTCYIVDNIICNVPTWGYHKKGEQPNFVIKGDSDNIHIDENNVAHIN